MLVSGTISEEQVITLLEYGARDYVMKDNLQRLPTTVIREVQIYHQRLADQKARNEYHKIRRLYDLYAANIDDVINLHDIDGTFKYVSLTVENVYGYKPNELIGNDGYNNIHPDDREKVPTDLKSCSRTPKILILLNAAENIEKVILSSLRPN